MPFNSSSLKIKCKVVFTHTNTKKKISRHISWHNVNYEKSHISSFLIPSKSVVIRTSCSNFYVSSFSIVAAEENNVHRASSNMPDKPSPAHPLLALFLFIYFNFEIISKLKSLCNQNFQPSCLSLQSVRNYMPDPPGPPQNFYLLNKTRMNIPLMVT